MDKLPDCREPDSNGVRSLPPDEFDLRTASTHILKTCPFCGRHPMTTCTVNDRTGIYGCRVICSDWRCGASTFSSSHSKEAARIAALASWDKRVER